MNWSTAADLRAQLARLWERGELLRDAVTGHTRFPLRLTLKGPTSQDITDRFVAVQAWAAQLAAACPVRLEHKQIQHRVQGAQQLPVAVWVDTLDEALGWLGKRREWQQFARLLDATTQQCPPLVAWLEKRPLPALELEADWAHLLAVVDWLQRHPRPGIYLRQVDVPGVHTKFIEAHRAVLTELLDLALPATSINPDKTGVAQFAARFGFLDKPTRVRLRLLDPAMAAVAGTTCPDITLDVHSLCHLKIAVQRVIITENETNFLALPRWPGTVAIFGAGYGWDALAQAQWLRHCAVYYWGDIDTHGFAILNQLRGHFAHAQSILMDRATLEAHTPFWGREDRPHTGDLHRLTPQEQCLFEDLREHRICPRLRLEQEHISFGWVQEQLQQVWC